MVQRTFQAMPRRTGLKTRMPAAGDLLGAKAVTGGVTRRDALSAIDRIGPEWHALSKRAKDMGSAAVFLSLLLAGGIWIAALHQFFSALK